MERRWGCGRDIFGVRVTRMPRRVGCCSSTVTTSRAHSFSGIFFAKFEENLLVEDFPDPTGQLIFYLWPKHDQPVHISLEKKKLEIAVLSLHYTFINTGSLGWNPSYFNNLSQSATCSVPVYLRRPLPDPRAGRASATVPSVSVSPSTRFSIDLLIDLNSSWDCTIAM